MRAVARVPIAVMDVLGRGLAVGGDLLGRDADLANVQIAVGAVSVAAVGDPSRREHRALRALSARKPRR